MGGTLNSDKKKQNKQIYNNKLYHQARPNIQKSKQITLAQTKNLNKKVEDPQKKVNPIIIYEEKNNKVVTYTSNQIINSQKKYQNLNNIKLPVDQRNSKINQQQSNIKQQTIKQQQKKVLQENKSKKFIKIVSQSQSQQTQKIQKVSQVMEQRIKQQKIQIFKSTPNPNDSKKGVIRIKLKQKSQINEEQSKKQVIQPQKLIIIPQKIIPPKIITQKKSANSKYIKQNIINLEDNTIDIELIIQQLRKMKVFNQYNQLKIKSMQQNSKSIRRLINLIQNQFECKLIKEKISETGVLFTLEKVKIQSIKQKKLQSKKKSQNYQNNKQSIAIENKKKQSNKKSNQIKIKNNINLKKQSCYNLIQNKIILIDSLTNQDKNLLLNEIQKKKQQLMNNFNKLRIFAPKILEVEARNLTQQIRTTLKWKKNNIETFNSSNNQCIFYIDLQQGAIQLQRLLNIKMSNTFTIVKQTNLNLLIEQLKTKINEIFSSYTRFRLKIEGEISDQKISELIMKLEKQFNVEKVKKDDQIQIIILTQFNKK